MKKSLFILGSIIAITILFYPQSSISLSTGSPVVMKWLPMDNSDCTSCHYTEFPTTVTTHISSNVASNGYNPGYTYTITISSYADCFEITCEENIGNTKTGIFFNTNPSETQLVNNGNAIKYRASGVPLNTWIFDWQAPFFSSVDITFDGAFIVAGYPAGSNNGDFLILSTWSISECTPPSAIGEYTLFKELFKVTDLLAWETKEINKPLLYIYDDGTIEKRIIME